MALGYIAAALGAAGPAWTGVVTPPGGAIGGSQVVTSRADPSVARVVPASGVTFATGTTAPGRPSLAGLAATLADGAQDGLGTR